MRHLKEIFLENWYLKLFSLFIAAGMWALIAQESISEIFFDVPVEYRNVPPASEVIGDTAKTVQVRLRGPSTLIREMTAKDVSPFIDLQQMPLGSDQYASLNSQHVHVPFGVEVLRITPASIKLSLEPTMSVTLPVEPQTAGHLPFGYEVASISARPISVKAEGAARNIRAMTKVNTKPIDLTNKRATFIQNVDLDASDNFVHFLDATSIRVEVKIRKKP